MSYACHSRVSCRLDTYRFSDWDIGYVTGLTVHLGNGGFFPAWNLDYVSANLFGIRETWEEEPMNTLDTKNKANTIQSINDNNDVTSKKLNFC